MATEFSRTLSLLRKERGVSQRVAAADLGVSQALLSHYENGIREQSYYHWQRRFRQQAYAEMKENVSVPAVTGKSELDFVEIPCTAVSETHTHPISHEPAAVIRTASFQIEISNDISDTLLSHILREVPLA